MKKVYVKKHEFGAGKWIYEGYCLAWQSLGYEAIYYSDLNEIKNYDSYIMAIDNDLTTQSIEKLEMSDRTFLFVQPTYFPKPWGLHPNFISQCNNQIISKINKLENITKWTFAPVGDHYQKWENVNEIPLAFDSVGYCYTKNLKYTYDVCFIGGWANNGFNEKQEIMIKWFRGFMDSGLKCGIFVGKNLTHEQENLILSNSIVSINVHDAYQQTLKLDSNERTFKALGLTGVLVSDEINQIQRLFPSVPLAATPKQMVEYVREYINMPSKQLNKIKEKNRNTILESHTYVDRVKALLKLKE